MPENQKKERLEYLYRLLSENAQAYDACLPGDALKSERRDSLRESMDSIAETMLSVMLDYRMPFRKNRRAELVQMVFLLDGQHSVAGFSSAASAVLKFRGTNLRRQPCLVLKKVYIFILNPKIDLQLIFSPVMGLQ